MSIKYRLGQWDCTKFILESVPFIYCLTISLNAAAICPDPNQNRLIDQGLEPKRVVETSDGSKYACWRDRNARPVTIQNETYNSIIKCSKTLMIYSHLDFAEYAIIENNGYRNLYKVEYLGDRFECDSKGQTMFKSWIYKSETDTLKQFDSSYIPYRW